MNAPVAARHPDPTERVVMMPAAVMVRQPAPGIIRDPGPAPPVGIAPVSVAIGGPSRSVDGGRPAIAIVGDVIPAAVAVQIIHPVAHTRIAGQIALGFDGGVTAVPPFAPVVEGVHPVGIALDKLGAVGRDEQPSVLPHVPVDAVVDEPRLTVANDEFHGLVLHDIDPVHPGVLHDDFAKGRANDVVDIASHVDDEFAHGEFQIDVIHVQPDERQFAVLVQTQERSVIDFDLHQAVPVQNQTIVDLQGQIDIHRAPSGGAGLLHADISIHITYTWNTENILTRQAKRKDQQTHQNVEDESFCHCSPPYKNFAHIF